MLYLSQGFRMLNGSVSCCRLVIKLATKRALPLRKMADKLSDVKWGSADSSEKIQAQILSVNANLQAQVMLEVPDCLCDWPGCQQWPFPMQLVRFFQLDDLRTQCVFAFPCCVAGCMRFCCGGLQILTIRMRLQHTNNPAELDEMAYTHWCSEICH